MAFDNLVVDRVMLHEVYKRRHDGALAAPRHGTALIVLPPEALDVFKERVVDAMGDQSQSMEMEISQSGADSAVALAASLFGKSDAVFVTETAKYAESSPMLSKPRTCREVCSWSSAVR